MKTQTIISNNISNQIVGVSLSVPGGRVCVPIVVELYLMMWSDDCTYVVYCSCFQFENAFPFWLDEIQTHNFNEVLPS